MENILQHQKNCSNKQEGAWYFQVRHINFQCSLRHSHIHCLLLQSMFYNWKLFFLEDVLQTLRLKHEGWGIFTDSVLLKLSDSLILLAVSDGIADLWGFTLNPKLFNWIWNMTEIDEAIFTSSFCFFLSKPLSKSLDHIQTYQEYSW